MVTLVPGNRCQWLQRCLAGAAATAIATEHVCTLSYRLFTFLSSDRLLKIDSFAEMQSCAANVTVHLERALNPVVAGISTLGPIVFWLFRDIRKPSNGLHILQAELHRNKQAERCAVVYG
jgi:hypothetical protein